jgi:hypothetical protein
VQLFLEIPSMLGKSCNFFVKSPSVLPNSCLVWEEPTDSQGMLVELLRRRQAGGPVRTHNIPDIHGAGIPKHLTILWQRIAVEIST